MNKKEIRFRTGLVLAGFALMAVACSSSSSSSGGRGAAADKCNALVSKMCDKLGPCESISKEECTSQANDTFKQEYGSDCSGADQVGDTYDACMNDIDSYECQAPIPASCNNTILFEQ